MAKIDEVLNRSVVITKSKPKTKIEKKHAEK
jgi:hypothetical protein